MISEIKSGDRKKVHYDISVIVLTYEQPAHKVLLTLASAVGQEKVDIQIILSDDGSSNPCLQECIDLMETAGFKEYKAIYHSQNIGTVMNFKDALEAADGEYIKSFGPGDCFSTNQAAYLWLVDVKKKKSRLSFCDAAYYRENQEKFESVIEVAHPQNLYVYDKKKKLQKKYYLLFNDIFLAAAVMCEKNLMYRYLQNICNKVKYAEDNMFRLMMLDNVECTHFAYNAVYYEWGCGVSTKEGSEFQKAIKRDWEETTEYICEHCRNNYLENKIKNYYLSDKTRRMFWDKIYYGLARLDFFIYNKRGLSKRLTESGDLKYLYILKNYWLEFKKVSDK